MFITSDEAINNKAGFLAKSVYFIYFLLVFYVFIFEVDVDVILISTLMTYLFAFSLKQYFYYNHNLHLFYKELDSLVGDARAYTNKSKGIYYLLCILNIFALGYFKIHRKYVGIDSDDEIFKYSNMVSNFLLKFLSAAAVILALFQPVNGFLSYVQFCVIGIILVYGTTIALFDIFLANVCIYTQADIGIRNSAISSFYMKHRLSKDNVVIVNRRVKQISFFLLPFLGIYLFEYIFGGGFSFENSFILASEYTMYQITLELVDKLGFNIYFLLHILLIITSAILETLALPLYFIYKLISFGINYVILFIICASFYYPIIYASKESLKSNKSLKHFVKIYFYVSYLTLLLIIAFI